MSDELPNYIVRFGSEDPFDFEVIGSIDAETAVIFAHGFGVKRDSRGLFTAIETMLHNEKIYDQFVSVQVDLSDSTDGTTTRAVPISEQAERIKHVMMYVQGAHGVSRFVFIGHSQGCLAIAKAAPRNCTIFLLAPPIESPAKKFMATPGWKRPGSVLFPSAVSVLVRSDGTRTIVMPEFWGDLRSMDAINLYQNLARNNNVEIIFAGADNVLGREPMPKDMHCGMIADADHDFNEPERHLLIAHIRVLMIHGLYQQTQSKV